jgi:aryl-alcohol dehydrogenase-like predicted oxidoreductase
MPATDHCRRASREIIMDRRTFLKFTSVALGTNLKALADTPMPMATLGKTGLRVSKFTLGGYHMAVKGEAEGIRIIHRAIDLGVNLFDSAHLYNDGRSGEIYGKALSGVETVEQLEENVLTLKTLRKMSQQEMGSLLARTKNGPLGTKVERYKRREASESKDQLHEDGSPA